MPGTPTAALADSTDFARVRFAAAGNPIVHETLDGEVVIINLKTGTYYSLQGPGAVVWETLIGGTTPAALASRLDEAAAIGAGPAAQAIAAMLGALHAEGLVVSEQPVAIPAAPLPDLPETLAAALTLQRFTDVQELLTIDPVHEVDEVGWPVKLEVAKLDPEA